MSKPRLTLFDFIEEKAAEEKAVKEKAAEKKVAAPKSIDHSERVGTLAHVLAPVVNAEIKWDNFSASHKLLNQLGRENIWCSTHNVPLLSIAEYAALLESWKKDPSIRISQATVTFMLESSLACCEERQQPQFQCVFIDRRKLPQFQHLDPASPDFDRYDAHLVSTMDHECG